MEERLNLKRFQSALAAALFSGATLAGTCAFSAELLMVEEEGCFWCEAWNNEISHIYPKTVEGKSAPLRRIDIDENLEQVVVLKRSVHFTPTFLLVEDGQEVSRIEGYPGEDFFWGLLEKMLNELPTETGEILNTSG